MLLSAGADVSAQDEFGQTALHVAACGAPETLARLLKVLRARARQARHAKRRQSHVMCCQLQVWAG
eukprot:2426138-Pleurochrysis_carterae.AAC.1